MVARWPASVAIGLDRPLNLPAMGLLSISETTNAEPYEK